MLREIPGSRNIDDTWGQRIKKFYVDIDPARLASAGVTNQDVAVSLNAVLSGMTIGEFRETDDTIPIVMREGSGQSLSYEDLETLSVFSQMSGRNVPLAQVASIRPQFQFPKILRRDLDGTVTVESDLKEGFTATEVTDTLVPWLEEFASTGSQATASRSVENPRPAPRPCRRSSRSCRWRPSLSSFCWCCSSTRCAARSPSSARRRSD
jgi:multidrug efflux pump subunit AcrB